MRKGFWSIILETRPWYMKVDFLMNYAMLAFTFGMAIAKITLVQEMSWMAVVRPYILYLAGAMAAGLAICLVAAVKPSLRRALWEDQEKAMEEAGRRLVER